MRSSTTMIVALLFLSLSNPPTSAADDAAAAIEAAIVAGYVEGVHKTQDSDAIRKGLHEAFVMSILRDGEIVQITRDEWIEKIEERKADRPADGPRPETEYEFKLLDRAGDAAVARVDIHKDGEHVYTDYMSLYRFDDGWKIVGKTFHSHD